MKRIAITVILILCVLSPAFFQNASNNDYPTVWANPPKDTLVDSWAMKSRECTSWVAWKVYETFNYSVYGWGDAKYWPAWGEIRSLIVDTEPQVNSVAVDASFIPGHVMWVERLNKNHTVHVSQYNAGGSGNYSEADRKTTGLVFIHFPVQP